MNVKRGLIRLWVLFSAVWSLSLLGLSAPDWYHAASYWYRSHGFEAARCDSQLEIDELKARILRAKLGALEAPKTSAATSGLKPPDTPRQPTIEPPAPTAKSKYTIEPPSPPAQNWDVVATKPAGTAPQATSDPWAVVNRTPATSAPAQKPSGLSSDRTPTNESGSKLKLPPGFTLDQEAGNKVANPFDQFDTPALINCFHVTVPDGSKYIVVVANDNWNAEEIRDVALYNPELFLPSTSAKRVGDATDPMMVDLTRGNPRPGPGRYLISGPPEHDHPDLGLSKILTCFAFVVPVGLFLLGRGIWWVAMGFRS
jgi:hypothetical protein